jgi:cysteine sulfinate desulfinase/cysteine desulfurase-like protein
VLRAMGGSNARTRNSLRFSLGPENTADEVEFVLSALPGLVTKLRGLTRTAAALR